MLGMSSFTQFTKAWQHRWLDLQLGMGMLTGNPCCDLARYLDGDLMSYIIMNYVEHHFAVPRLRCFIHTSRVYKLSDCFQDTLPSRNSWYHECSMLETDGLLDLYCIYIQRNIHMSNHDTICLNQLPGFAKLNIHSFKNSTLLLNCV